MSDGPRVLLHYDRTELFRDLIGERFELGERQTDILEADMACAAGQHIFKPGTRIRHGAGRSDRKEP